MNEGHVARIALEGVCANYGSRFLLGPIAFTFEHGVTCLVGANGAGKSTLFRLIAGIQRPSAGSVTASSAGPVGYVPQDPELPFYARCDDYLTHVAWLQRVPVAERWAAVSHAMDGTGMAEHAGMTIGKLSGGMRRRLAIASALVAKPDVLLLDEPTAGLDPLQRIELRTIISQYAQTSCVIVSTHLLDDVLALGGDVVILADGQQRFAGTTSDLERLDPGTGPGNTALERAVAHFMKVNSDR